MKKGDVCGNGLFKVSFTFCSFLPGLVSRPVGRGSFCGFSDLSLVPGDGTLPSGHCCRSGPHYVDCRQSRCTSLLLSPDHHADAR